MYNQFMNISVIIPSCGRASAIKTVDSIINCDLGDISYEIILVTPYFVKELGSLSVKQSVIYNPVLPGKARNIGAALAVGELLLFVDDDCTVASDWLTANWQAYQSNQALLYGGQIFDKSKTYWGQAVGWANFSYCRLPYSKNRFVSTTTLGVSREVFLAIGGFDEYLRVKEDTDFCVKGNNYYLNNLLEFSQYQACCQYSPAIKVFHFHNRVTFSSFLSYMYRNGRLSGWQVERKFIAGNKARMSLFSRALFYLLNNKFGLFFALIPLSLLSTILVFVANIFPHPVILLYLPAIFLGKFSTWLGIFVWQCREG